MLRTQDNRGRGGSDERGEDDRELYGIDRVQIEGLHSDVVEAIDNESGFLTYFPYRRALGQLTILDVPVHRLPCERASRAHRSLQRQHLPARRHAVGLNHIYVYDTRKNFGHGFRQVEWTAPT